MANFTRFIALGDSMTEGMCDDIVDGQYRGWADRLADVLAEQTKGFSYFNLAIRGKLLHQVINDQIPIAKRYIEGPQTLVSFNAGANDVLRPNYKPEKAMAEYRAAVADLAATGATLILYTAIEKVDGKGKAAELWHQRFSDFNINVRAVAKEHGAFLAEARRAPYLGDKRFLHSDRLHLNTEGHRRFAEGVKEVLGLPFDSTWNLPLGPAPKKNFLVEKAINVKWIITFVIPWIWRRLRGKSSGDGRSAKHFAPVPWPSNQQ
jgi:lysophospholipase L1-like esterase